MATGRTKDKWTRVYVDGFDVSGYARSVGPLDLVYDEVDLTAYQDPAKGYLAGHPQVNIGMLNTVFDNTATVGVHTVLQTAGAIRTVLVAKGIRGEPAESDPCFGGQFTQGAYQAEGEYMSVPFMGWAANSTSLLYACPWGQILHPNSIRLAATGANTAVGFDNPTENATSKGGFFLYMVTAGNGTATISMDDSATNANDGAFAPIVAATSGELNCAVKQYGIVPITGAVRRYLRWQIAFNTATTVTFLSAFMRSY